MTPVEARRRFATLPDAVAKAMAAGLDDVAQSVAAEARLRLGTVKPSRPGLPPADPSGTLAEGIGTDRGPDGSAAVTVASRYAVDLEYGTTRMAARPFLRPAIAATGDDARRMLGKAFARAVSVALRGLP